MDIFADLQYCINAVIAGGWVQEMASFADLQNCINADIVGGWVQEMASFADVQYCINTDILDGSEKVQNCADAVYGWYLKLPS